MAALAAQGRAGCDALARCDQSLPDQFGQPFAGDFTVPGLTAGFLGPDQHGAVLRPAPPRQSPQPGLDRRRQAWRTLGFETQFNGGFDLVHILSPRSLRPGELFGKLPFLDLDMVVDAQHETNMSHLQVKKRSSGPCACE